MVGAKETEAVMAGIREINFLSASAGFTAKH
jgi:hypothetical protein